MRPSLHPPRPTSYHSTPHRRTVQHQGEDEVSREREGGKEREKEGGREGGGLKRCILLVYNMVWSHASIVNVYQW